MARLSMSVRVNDRQGDAFGDTMARRLAALQDGDRQARIRAAQEATAESRRIWNSRPNKRAVVAPRAGRSGTGGRLGSFIEWRSGSRGGEGLVELNMKKLDADAEHWIIQEIGTGQRATIRRGGKANPTGRPAAGATHVRTVKSQRGRRIRSGLVFASGGKYSPPGSKTGEQIHLASQVTGVPPRVPAIRIRNEIKGQHFIKRGAEKGFREYRGSVLAAARDAFRKSNVP